LSADEAGDVVALAVGSCAVNQARQSTWAGRRLEPAAAPLSPVAMAVWVLASLYRNVHPLRGISQLGDGPLSPDRHHDLNRSRAERGEREAVVKITILAMAFLAGIGFPGTTLAQVPTSCAPGQVCLYDNVGYGGAVSRYTSNASSLGGADNRASSAYNATSQAVRLYDGNNFAGANICLNPNTGIDNLVNFGLNDAISSVRVGPGGSC
jgi:hypothetical protein